MSTRKVTTVRQLEMLVHYMAQHRDLAFGRVCGKEYAAAAQRHWTQLAERLNAEGPCRSWKEWSKIWIEAKSKVHKKLIDERAGICGTGGGPHSICVLTPIQELISDIIGRDVGPIPGARVHGQVPMSHGDSNTVNTTQDEGGDTQMVVVEDHQYEVPDAAVTVDVEDGPSFVESPRAVPLISRRRRRPEPTIEDHQYEGIGTDEVEDVESPRAVPPLRGTPRARVEPALPPVITRRRPRPEPTIEDHQYEGIGTDEVEDVESPRAVPPLRGTPRARVEPALPPVITRRRPRPEPTIEDHQYEGIGTDEVEDVESPRAVPPLRGTPRARVEPALPPVITRRRPRRPEPTIRPHQRRNIGNSDRVTGSGLSQVQETLARIELLRAETGRELAAAAVQQANAARMHAEAAMRQAEAWEKNAEALQAVAAALEKLQPQNRS